MKKRMYQGTRIQTHHHQTCNRKIIICRMVAIPVNRLKKSVGNTRIRMRQTHRQEILICMTTVTKDASDVKRRAIRKRVL